MYSFDKTQCRISKQKGANSYEKTNNSGIAVCGITVDAIG